ncbi:chromatin modification-related protein EAF7-domain-containing protein [Xylariaceae sp. FL0662B]|nr:chromatin modification-related protein EAF7-domain-containing protein [Xylariaceae sp. FL0662B]
MPPKRKPKASLAEISTPKASSTPLRDDDHMDVDAPKASETPRAADIPTASRPSQPPASEILNDLWTDDQTSSLFKAIIRWKPSGIHKHFRMIAISEHLRNHGFDPDVETHTRIPSIWKQLSKFYNMEAINERDNAFDYVKGQDQDELPERKYNDFDLPPDDFHDLMWSRAMAEPGEEATSPAEMETDAPTSSVAGTGVSRKRKRGATTNAADTSSIAGSSTAKTRRSSTVEDTDQETPGHSSPVTRSARGTRSQKRAAAKAKAESAEPDADEEGEDGDGEAEDGDEEEEEADEEEGDHEETEAPATRSGRGGTAKRRGRGRGRSKAGRKKG